MQFVNIFLVTLNLGIAIGAPNHVKVVKTLESNEIPSVSVGAGGVSASWGGYSAKAGLGGNAGVNGGLYASADSPHGNAAAGLGGNVGGGDSVSGVLGASASSPYGGSASAGLGGNTNSGTTYIKEVTVQGGSSANSQSSAGDSSAAGSGSYASSGASAGSGSIDSHTQVVYNTNKQGGLFDNIFNIPISVLQAVNGLLNQQHGGAQVTKTVRVRGHGHHGHRRTGIDNRNAFSQSESFANANAYESHNAGPAPAPALPPPVHPAHAAASGGASGSAGATVTIQKGPVNYDNIFNIPISALRAVNKLLNDGAASISKNIQVQGSAHVSHSHAGGAQIAHGHSKGAHVAHGHAGNVEVTKTHAVPSNVAAGGSAELHVQVGHQGTLESSQPQALTSAAYTAQKPAGFYDNVFNIPITALKSVNQLLNG